MFDRWQLDGGAVSADDDQPFGGELLHPLGEALGAHGPHHHQQFVTLFRLDGMLEGAAEHVADFLQAGGDGARADGIVIVVEEQIHQVQHRQHADHLAR